MARFLFLGANLSAGSGQYRISLPLPVDYGAVVGSGTIAAGTCLGFGRIRDFNTSANNAPVYLQPPDPSVQEDVVFMVVITGNASVTNSAPFTPTNWTRISVHFHYPADPDGLPR
jgi:hypothetical protein